ncbi:ABC-type glutathione transport system ATPase component [Pararhizobium capsulatum DSM 1112]|uniref:ABC-type glutathione transport system ATPase component n=1 Tax=Pararhizobium capsulatum DSM 1112 TaxID=1121113 RepID=A0ABU0BYT4_9HYPH|nr:ATP-binding cassette domain-containing protein [Pararhizobium capsulatum]MDQ0323427.1 ABC-type glutathione transport system ATPase component [Pararhizobium capsulatum DSM 1112]
MSTSGATPIIAVEGLVKRFHLRHSMLDSLRGVPPKTHVAIDNVSFSLNRGEILGLAGQSGSGKSTVARCLTRLVTPDSGMINLDGEDIRAVGGASLREARRRMQMIYQDPYTSLNPRMTVGAAILEAGQVHRQPGSEHPQAFVSGLLEQVGLPAGTALRRPRELSGGQRQRVAIARSLAVGPDILIADEAVSALDVSVQVQLLNLFVDLRDQLGLSILFISHQLAVLAEVCDRVAIMNRGRIVEIGTTTDVFTNPQDAYTRELLAAHPDPDPSRRNKEFA